MIVLRTFKTEGIENLFQYAFHFSNFASNFFLPLRITTRRESSVKILDKIF